MAYMRKCQEEESRAPWINQRPERKNGILQVLERSSGKTYQANAPKRQSPHAAGQKGKEPIMEGAKIKKHSRATRNPKTGIPITV